MFFLKEEERTVTLHPSFFGPHIETYIRNQLFHDVEGQILGDYFTICVLDNILISEGKVIPGSAFAEFTVHYRAIVWKPFKGEVVDGTVGTCIEAGFFVDIGPLQAFVESGVSPRIFYNSRHNTRHANGVQQRIPPEVKFDPHSTPPQWTDGGDQIIEKNGHVRLKFMGLRTEPGKMFAVGDINFDYLG